MNPLSVAKDKGEQKLAQFAVKSGKCLHLHGSASCYAASSPDEYVKHLNGKEHMAVPDSFLRWTSNDSVWNHDDHMYLNHGEKWGRGAYKLTKSLLTPMPFRQDTQPWTIACR